MMAGRQDTAFAGPAVSQPDPHQADWAGAGFSRPGPALPSPPGGELCRAALEDALAYTVDEAAQATRLSRDLLYDEMRAGRLAYLKVGRRRIITRQHLEAFLTQRAS